MSAAAAQSGRGAARFAAPGDAVSRADRQRPAINSSISSRRCGLLESMSNRANSVTKGTLLFGIERDTYQQQLDQANTTLAANEATLEYNRAGI